MDFDVPKVVRNPGCDHGHDEESRNGRDMKIDILEAYIWISEVFRVKSGFYRSTGRLPEPPGRFMIFDVPKEFGVPDEIGDMTRSREMVET